MPRIPFRRALPFAVALSLACDAEPHDYLGSGPRRPSEPTQNARLAFRVGDLGEDQVSDLAVDAVGSVYVTGTFTGSVDFDPGAGLGVLTSLGATDVFVAKYSSTNALVWARQLGGSGTDASSALTLDANGDVVIAGWFDGNPDFDPGPGTVVLPSAGGTDGFVARISGAGAFAWARRFGGADADQLVDVAASGGIIYAAGYFQGAADGSPGGTGPVGAPGLGRDLVVLSFEGSGAPRGALVLGGPGDETANGVAVVGSSFIVTGNFDDDLDFDPGTDIVSRQPVGTRDGFVAGFTSTGALEWVRTIGGTGEVTVADNGISFGGGSVHVTGGFTGAVDLDSGPGTVTAQSQGLEDVFVLRLDAGGGLTDAFTIGGTQSESSRRTAADGSGFLVAGTFTAPLDVDPGTGTSVITPLGTGGATDAFVVRYSPARQVVWARGFGAVTSGPGSQTTPLGVGIGTAGQIVFGGRFFGDMDVDPASAIFVLSSFGGADGFVVRLTSAGALATSQ